MLTALVKSNMVKSVWQKRSGRAFTLVELMVTIAILALLVSLTVVAIVRAKQKTRLAHCASNLHQHGIALHSFLSDNSVYPLVLNPGFRLGIESEHYSSIWSALDKHGLGPPTEEKGGVHVCPSAASQKVPVSGENRPITGYAYNVHGMGRRLEDDPQGLAGMFKLGTSFLSPVPESAVINPTEMIAMGDGVRGWETTYEDGVGFLSRTPTKEYAGSNSRVPRRHEGRLVILFCDGHVTPLSLKRLFEDKSDDALRLWNRDNQPHRERLNVPKP
jgi:prepilin-type N-terminal cleavage/methylation domain-containing protein/prepilin-type processing-associated H-X9-DG protein